MTCPKCGFANEGSPKFCMKCGNSLVNPVTEQSVQQPIQDVSPSNGVNDNFQQSIQQPVQPQNMTNEFVAVQQPIQNPTATEFSNVNVQSAPQEYHKSSGSLNYMFFILAVLLKPVSSIKEELHKFEDTKTSMIFAALIAGATTVITLIKTIFSAVYTSASSGFMGYGATEAKWTFENLKNIKWIEVIFKNFLVYAGVLVAIALVYYLASLILKKNVNFKKLLGIASIALIPVVLITMVVSPLVGKLWTELGLILTVVGALYGGAILIYGLNSQMNLEDNDMKIYVHVICMSILIIVGSYIMTRIASGSISGGSGLDMLDFFN